MLGWAVVLGLLAAPEGPVAVDPSGLTPPTWKWSTHQAPLHILDPDMGLRLPALQALPKPRIESRGSWRRAAWDLFQNDRARVSMILDLIRPSWSCGENGPQGLEIGPPGACLPLADASLGLELALRRIPLSFTAGTTVSRVGEQTGVGVMVGLRFRF